MTSHESLQILKSLKSGTFVVTYRIVLLTLLTVEINVVTWLIAVSQFKRFFFRKKTFPTLSNFSQRFWVQRD